MGLCMKGSRLTMARFVGLEPCLWVESLRLSGINIHARICGLGTVYLFHALEEFFSAPPIQSPVIIVLLVAANAKRTIAPTRSSEESTPAQFHLAVINSRHGRSDDVPIGFGIEVV
jgi:hypothetical protein